MFTGIIQSVGRVVRVENKGVDARLTLATGGLAMDDVALGDSIACNGVCLTVIEAHSAEFSVDVSAETLRCTTGFAPQALINMEKAMRLEDRLGGHLVSGHVDGVGTVLRFEPVGDCMELVIRAPETLAQYIVTKGSVAINGVSLTVNDVNKTDFSINLIPHTLNHTNLHVLTTASQVNLEVDVMARYAERILNYNR